VQRTIVSSSNIASVGFKDDILEVEFCHGGVYRYFGVPVSVYRSLLVAKSKGEYLNAAVKAAGYQYSRVSEAA
jgi:hypothetical protein